MDSDDSSEAEEPIIFFKHSPRSDELEATQSRADDQIHSPSDIYRLYGKPVCKSILKKERSFEDVKSKTISSASPNKPFKQDRGDLLDKKQQVKIKN